MTEADRNLLDYIVVCTSEFANRYGMHMRDAYIYLNRYKGIEFLKEFYDVEHTLIPFHHSAIILKWWNIFNTNLSE